MMYRATILLPGTIHMSHGWLEAGHRTWLFAASDENEAWDLARAECSPSEEVRRIEVAGPAHKPSTLAKMSHAKLDGLAKKLVKETGAGGSRWPQTRKGLIALIQSLEVGEP